MDSPLLPLRVFDRIYGSSMLSSFEPSAKIKLSDTTNREEDSTSKATTDSSEPKDIKTSISFKLQTKYGLQMEIATDDASPEIDVAVSVQQADSQYQDSPKNGPLELEEMIAALLRSKRYYYRLLPDYQTSFLFYDPGWFGNPPGEFHVDIDTLSDRYPALDPCYYEWQEAYEKSFKRQGCHLGSRSEAFPDMTSRVAWEVAGFLITCFLLLQDDVGCVSYVLPKRTYEIKKNGIKAATNMFLKDECELLMLRRD